MATMITHACSFCSKSFGENHQRCAQHVKAPKGQCMTKGAVAKHVQIIVGIHDRNVGGRVTAIGHGPNLNWGPQADGLGSESDLDAATHWQTWKVTVVAVPPSRVWDLRWLQLATQVLIHSIHIHPHTYPCSYPVVPRLQDMSKDNLR
jgi:hypothetical protein